MAKKLKILAASDLHGSIDIAKKLSAKAKKNKVDLVILAGDINGSSEGDGRVLEPFEKAKQKVIFVPGNWDTREEHEDMRKMAKSVDNYYVSYGDVGIGGIGNMDWNFSFDKDDLNSIKKNFKRMKPKKRILVSHIHAAGTKAEFSGIPGDKILREAVENIKPDILISGHIHEGEGIEDMIGNTRVIQVGRNGKIIEI